MRYVTFILIFSLFGCKSLSQKSPVKVHKNTFLLNKKVIKNWHLKDIEKDSIIGISLNRAYDNLLINKKPYKNVIAIIDTEVDIMHSKLANRIWINEDEIPNNNNDDDGNGYIDDVNGWNFTGNKDGKSSLFVNFEYVRILRLLNKKYQGFDSTSIKKDVQYLLYTRAKKAYKKREKYEEKQKRNNEKFKKLYYPPKNKIDQLFGKKTKLSAKLLDSLKVINLITDKDAIFLKDCVKRNVDSTYIADYLFLAKQRREKLLNLDYFDRTIVEDDENNIQDSIYGNNILNGNLKWMTHGTRMSGVIIDMLKKNESQIMPVITSGYGDEHDKDIALAIRYAVNNGAKVINMSFSKEFTKNFNWVKDAIQYAQQKDVLVISAAGNFGNNLNLKGNKTYPNDNFNGEDEYSDNFLLVGATNAKLNKNFRRKDSNYGNKQVDLFAPGYKITSIGANNKNEEYTSATSAASMITSGVASLIRSYYPNLTASQVKHILMDSGLEFTFEVSTPTKEDKNKTTPFNKISKSGKYLNVYNALLMADRISKD